MMKQDLEAMQRELSCCMSSTTKRTVLFAMGAVGAVTLLGVGAAMVYNSKQMKAARALKRTGRILYMLGTAMRSISGIEMFE